MRLTVGPYPAAVYWRRRAVVLVALAIVVLVIWYAFGGTSSSNAGPQPSVTPTSTLLHPTSASPKPPASPTPTPTPTPTPFTLPTNLATTVGAPVSADAPCTDAEMSVTVKAGSAQVQRGQPVSLTIAITNVSDRTCSRDVGADVQEIRLLDGSTIIWSSDDCNANHGHDIRSFAPGADASFTLTWPGGRSRTGTGAKVCTTVVLPDAKTYQLIGRLDQKLSSPFTLQIGP